jgi:hypothetical protein
MQKRLSLWRHHPRKATSLALINLKSQCALIRIAEMSFGAVIQITFFGGRSEM